MASQRVVQRQQGVLGVDHFVEEDVFQVQRAAGGAQLKPGFGVGAVGQRLAGALKVGGALHSGQSVFQQVARARLGDVIHAAAFQP